MAKTYYETLGIGSGAKESEIKAAYRRLVLRHHPDKSKDPNAPQIFRGITEAFEILSDPEQRKRYDEHLVDEVRRRRDIRDREIRDEQIRKQRSDQVAEAANQTRAESPVQTKPKLTDLDIAEMLRRLSVLLGRQRFNECEMLARQIIQVDPRRSLPYAVLGDISRARGSLDDAARMYSFALQMEPSNHAYLKSYEEILDRSNLVAGKNDRIKVQPQEKRIFALLAIASITLLACIYVVLSPEKAVLGSISVVSSWTIGIIVMLFLSGASAGAALSIANLIDRVDSTSSGKINPALIYAAIAIFSFPIALTLYGMLGTARRSFVITTTRLMGAVASITFCLGMSAAVSQEGISFFQTVLWGGNLVYIGAIGGWTVADSLRG